VLAERKVMAFVQRRKGPDVVGSFGLLQPLADGLKLILKEPISPSSANFSLFIMAPMATFMLSLVAWAYTSKLLIKLQNSFFFLLNPLLLLSILWKYIASTFSLK
jgi:NADH:ubiquinone oxidoreductase subunit H